MNKNLKKIIAREGLIILGIIIGGGIITGCLASIGTMFKNMNIVESAGVGLCSIYLYPFYLLIRFIFWAIKTVREK